MFGLGEAASGFAIAAAASMHDSQTARALALSAWAAAEPVEQRGTVSAPSLPTVGHAVILYGKSLIE